MKKTLQLKMNVSVIVFLFLAGFHCTQDLKAQGFNRSFPENMQVYVPILFERGSELYFWEGGGRTGIARYNEKGDSLPFNPSLSIIAGVPKLGGPAFGNKVVLIGDQNYRCSGSAMTYTNSFSITDSAGTAVSTSTYESASHIAAWIQLPDSTFLTFSGSDIVHFGKTAAVIVSHSCALNSISAACLLPGGEILISASSGAYPQLAKITSSGAVLVMQSQPVLYKKFRPYGSGTFLALGLDGQLYKLSPALDVINAGTIHQGARILDFEARKDTIYAILTLANSTEGYSIADTSFNVLHASSTGNNQNMRQLAIAFSGKNKVAILYDAMASPEKKDMMLSRHYCTGINVVPRYSGNHFSKDLALRKIVPLAVSSSSSATTNHFSAKVQATVRNVGTVPVTSFYLNCYNYPPVHCGDFRYIEKFSVNIAPGDSVIVNTSHVGRSVFGVTRIDSIVSARYCFYVTLPDSSTDANLHDNEICTTFSATIAGLDNQVRSAIKVFPNPATNLLTISHMNGAAEISFHDALGAEIRSVRCTEREAEIDLSTWAPGLYLMHIKMGGEVLVKKIVKE